MTTDAPADRPPGPARRRLAPEVRRRQVLDAAVAVFSEQGFQAASMDAVAARAGVSKPSVYAHGGTKEELFTACLRRESDRLLRTVSAAASRDPARTDPQTRLWLGLRAFFVAVTTRRQGWTVLYRQAATGSFAGEVDALRRRIVARAAALLAEGLGADPATVVPFAHTLVGAAEGLADWWLADDALTGDDAADVLARMLMTATWPGLDALRTGRVWEPPIASSQDVSGER